MKDYTSAIVNVINTSNELLLLNLLKGAPCKKEDANIRIQSATDIKNAIKCLEPLVAAGVNINKCDDLGHSFISYVCIFTLPNLLKEIITIPNIQINFDIKNFDQQPLSHLINNSYQKIELYNSIRTKYVKDESTGGYYGRRYYWRQRRRKPRNTQIIMDMDEICYHEVNDMLRMFMEYTNKADVLTATDRFGNTLLHLSDIYTNFDPKAFKNFLDMLPDNFDYSARNQCSVSIGLTIVSLFLNNRISNQIVIDAMTELVAHGYDITTAVPDGDTLSHYLITMLMLEIYNRPKIYAAFEIIQHFDKLGLSMNIKNKEGTSIEQALNHI